MKNALPIVLTLLALAAGLWIFLQDDGAEPDGALDHGDVDRGGTPELMEAPGLAAGADPPAKTPRGRDYKPIDPRTIPRGEIEVLPITSDGTPVPGRTLKVRVNTTGRADWRSQVGHYDAETHAWTFKKVLAGEVRVRVLGDHVLESTKLAVVPAGQRARVTVAVKRAGAIHYSVVGPDDKPPKTVQLTLYDAQNDKPVKAWFQARSTRMLTQERYVTTIEQGPEGVVFGIKPGAYRLKVENDINEWDEADVEVVADVTQDVKLKLGR